jgi:hypothetical protein
VIILKYLSTKSKVAMLRLYGVADPHMLHLNIECCGNEKSFTGRASKFSRYLCGNDISAILFYFLVFLIPYAVAQ